MPSERISQTPRGADDPVTWARQHAEDSNRCPRGPLTKREIASGSEGLGYVLGCLAATCLGILAMTATAALAIRLVRWAFGW